MRSGIRFLAIAFIVSALLSSVVAAQYMGPSALPVYRSVSEGLENPIDDAPVVLEGYIVRQVEKKKYIFSDETAEIKVEISHKYFPATPIDDKTKVRIRGEIEKDFLKSPEIDVESVEIIK